MSRIQKEKAFLFSNESNLHEVKGTNNLLKKSVKSNFYSKLPTLDLLHDALGEAIDALGVVLFFERRTVEPRKSLVETGFHGAENGLDEAVGRAVALAIDEFDE